MKLLIIQTAFIGDVILSTALVEKIKIFHPNAEITYLVRKGNESLLKNHPNISSVIVWDKQQNKYKNLFKLIKHLRTQTFDQVICLQRFAAMGFLTWRMRAKHKIGFNKNPFKWFFHKSFAHSLDNGLHEVDRNQLLIEHLTDKTSVKPKLYPSDEAYLKVKPYTIGNYYVIAPNSVWYTKEVPQNKWLELMASLTDNTIYLVGAPGDSDKCSDLIKASNHQNCINLAGKLSFLESCALIEHAKMTYACDSAPMHMASAMNAPIKAVYCSTIPQFGFGPLSDDSEIIQTSLSLNCRPCGLHGYKSCPEGDFRCAHSIDFFDKSSKTL